MYIKDTKSKKVWSNTFAPINTEPDKYEIVFASDKIKYIRRDNDIITKTEIIVTPNHHAEIRKITFTNNSNEIKNLELTTYTEVILSDNADDVSHRTFNSMFIESEFDENTKSLIMKRDAKNEGSAPSFMINRLLTPNDSEITFETDRFQFIGRNRNTNNPLALQNDLSCNAGVNIEPIMSLRTNIQIPKGMKRTVYYINGFGRSREQLMEIIETYNNPQAIEKSFDLSLLNHISNTKKLDLTGQQMRLYNIMLNYLYQTTKISVSEERRELLCKNASTQSALWKYGISGDRPIILVNIHDISDIDFVIEVLKAFEYYKNSSIFVDIVILNSEDEKYASIIKDSIDEELYRIFNTNNFHHIPGSIYLLQNSDIEQIGRAHV